MEFSRQSFRLTPEKSDHHLPWAFSLDGGPQRKQKWHNFPCAPKVSIPTTISVLLSAGICLIILPMYGCMPKNCVRPLRDTCSLAERAPLHMSVLQKRKTKQLAQKLNLQDMTANKLIIIHMGKGQAGQETKVPQMSTMFSHQNSNQKKALEPAVEPTFYQTRCRLAVLRKLHNTTQDLVCGDSVKNHVQPGGAHQTETCWISINFSVQRNFTGQIIASVKT